MKNLTIFLLVVLISFFNESLNAQKINVLFDGEDWVIFSDSAKLSLIAGYLIGMENAIYPAHYLR